MQTVKNQKCFRARGEVPFGVPGNARNLCSETGSIYRNARKTLHKNAESPKTAPISLFFLLFFGFLRHFGCDQYSAMDGGEKAPGEVFAGENVKTHKFRMASLAVLPENAGGQNPAGRF